MQFVIRLLKFYEQTLFSKSFEKMLSFTADVVRLPNILTEGQLISKCLFWCHSFDQDNTDIF